MALMTPERVLEELTSRASVGSLQQLIPSRQRGGEHLIPRSLTHEGLILEHHLREGRFQRSLALIAGMSGFLGGLEVTYEHYRGSYSQRIMYSPVFISGALAMAGVATVFSRRAARIALPLTSALLLADGVIGFIFHIRGIARKPGGWRIPIFNVIMGPPLFAPLLLTIGGFLGVIASYLRREDDPAVDTASFPPLPRPGRSRSLLSRFIPQKITQEGLIFEQDVREGKIQRVLAAATAVSAVLNGAESLYSHYKNGFKYKVQWTPILLSPIVALSGIGAIFSKRIAHTILPLTSFLALADGGIGFFYHVRGVGRRSGGWTHWVYNILYGPPIFAPLLYSATGFLGLLASLLRRA